MSEQKFEPYQQVLVRDSKIDMWVCAFFSHYIDEDEDTHGKYVCAGGSNWKFCIPYKGNEHLAGNCESPDSKFEFGDKVMVRDRDSIWYKATFVEYVDCKSKPYRVITKMWKENGNFEECKKGWDDDK